MNDSFVSMLAASWVQRSINRHGDETSCKGEQAPMGVACTNLHRVSVTPDT